MAVDASPRATFEAALATDPTAATPIFTDLTSRWLTGEGWGCEHGRATELERFKAGQASATLDNTDRALDPTYAAGPYAAMTVTTTLTAAIVSTSATSITVASSASLPTDRFTLTVDSEQLLVTAGYGTTTLTVQRGYGGTTAATHSNGATCTWTTLGLYPGRRCRIKAWLNLLAAAEGSATAAGAGGIGSWAAAANATVTGSTMGAYTSADGDAFVVAITQTVSGTDASMTTATGTSGKPVVPGRWYTGAAKAGVASGTCTGNLALRWYTAAGTLISTSASADATIPLYSGTLATFTVTAQAPATAAYVALVATVKGALAGAVLWDYNAIYPMGSAPSSWVAGGGTTVFDGYVESWPPSWSHPSWSQVDVSADDAFERLAAARLAVSPYEVEVRKDLPLHWWRLGEPAGSSVVQDAGYGTPALGTPITGSTFGGAPLAAADTERSLSMPFSPTGAQAGGFSVPATATPSASLLTWTWEAMVAADNGSDLEGVWALSLYGARLTVQLHFNDRAVLSVTDDFGTVTTTSRTIPSGALWSDGGYHHIAVTRLTGTIFTVFVDGVAGTSIVLGTPFNPPDGPGIFGSFLSAATSGTWRIGKVAWYDGLVSTARLQAHTAAALAPWDGDNTATRIGRILDAVGWPAADRSIDTGNQTLGAVSSFMGNNALSELQKVEEAEGGALWMTPDGKVRFRRRRAIYEDTRSVNRQAAITDTPSAATDVPSAGDPEPAWDRALVINESRVARDGASASEQVATTPTRSRYGLRTRSRTLNLPDDNEARRRAEWDVNIYGDAHLRIDAVAVRPMTPNQWVTVLGLGIGDRVRFVRTPPGGGAAIDVDGLIEGRRIEVDKGRWTFVFRLNTRETVDVARWGTARWGSSRWAL